MQCRKYFLCRIQYHIWYSVGINVDQQLSWQIKTPSRYFIMVFLCLAFSIFILHLIVIYLNKTFLKQTIVIYKFKLITFVSHLCWWNQKKKLLFTCLGPLKKVFRINKYPLPEKMFMFYFFFWFCSNWILKLFNIKNPFDIGQRTGYKRI